LAPWGIPDPPEADEAADDVDVDAGAEDEDEVAAGAAELDELDEPELPQPATARQIATSAKPPKRLIDVALPIGWVSNRVVLRVTRLGGLSGRLELWPMSFSDKDASAQ
jgi:hypothetical protein